MNDCVLVRLTDLGRKMHQEAQEPACKALNIAYSGPKTDDSGWSKFQLHDLISLFGSEIGICCELPFETNMMIEVK